MAGKERGLLKFPEYADYGKIYQSFLRKMWYTVGGMR